VTELSFLPPVAAAVWFPGVLESTGAVEPKGTVQTRVQPTSPKLYSYKRKIIKAELETPCARLSNRLESLGGGQSYYYRGNSTSGYIIIIPPKLVFTKQNITFNM
jgi:hypothetical protein